MLGCSRDELMSVNIGEIQPDYSPEDFDGQAEE
jgi:hypothetical protein